MDKVEALVLWNKEMGNKEYAYDFSGRKIKRDDYNIQNQVGWVISYIKPLELGGSDDDGNIIIMHHLTCEEKGLRYPRFDILNKNFIARHDEKDDFYYLEEDLDGGYDD